MNNWDVKNCVGGGAVNSLFHNIVSLSNLLLAWKEFKKCKSAKKDIVEFEFNLENNLFELQKELVNKTYKSNPYEAFFVHDPKRRHIHKATVRDRVLNQAVFRILYQIFDKHFIFHSYSSRIEKGTHKASKKLFVSLCKKSKNWRQPVFILKCDVRKFFDSIDHQILFELINKKISDIETIWLVDKILKSFEKSPRVGLPLGNVTSQLFANIYLNELDQFIKHKLKVKYYFRYADDFILTSSNEKSLLFYKKEIENFLEQNLKIKLHPNKVLIRKLKQGIDFVGYVILPNATVLRTKTKNRIFKKLKKAQKELIFGGISKEKFHQIKTSYLGVIKHCKNKKLKRDLGKFLFL
jgi:retron-type reverse transcriptase